MIIHGPSNYHYDIDLGPVILSDCKCLEGKFWCIPANRRTDYHKDYFEIVEESKAIQIQVRDCSWYTNYT